MAASLVALAAPLAAHEEGVIRLSARSAPAGQEIDVRGERLPKSSELRLELAGALATHPIAVVRTDSAGRFESRVTIPAEARPGLYRVVATASDGDEVARADLVVLTAMPEIETAAPEPAVHPTDAMMDLPVDPGMGEWAVVALWVGVAALGGALLLRGSRTRL